MTSAIPDDFPELGAVAQKLADAVAPDRHGDLERWRRALAALPPAVDTRLLCGPTVSVSGRLAEPDTATLAAALQALRPWRKGPFDLFGVRVDAEWRSDLKWERLAPRLDVTEHRVLDVGCGNGYFGWRLLGAGARAVLGVDPTLLFCLQHQAINRYAAAANHAVVPLRFEDLPAGSFDTVLSMGVVYHRRDPAAHVRKLHAHTRPGGQVVLESLIVPGNTPLIPEGRYARMRNVWCVPTLALLQTWLRSAGFEDVEIVDVTPTTPAEQRSTEWMTFESLAAALDPLNPALTIEGYPAPTRAVALARRPPS